MKPQPTLSLDEFRRQSRTLQTNRTKAREEYEAHTQEEAQAEHDYSRPTEPPTSYWLAPYLTACR